MTVIYEPARQVAQHFAMLLGGDARTAATLDEVHAILDSDRAELLVVFGPGTPVPEAVSFAARQRLSRPTLGVVLLRHNLEVSVLSEAIRSGVREVADVADPASVLAACARSLDLSRRQLAGPVPDHAEPRHSVDAKVVSVFSAKGGTGKTMIATNLAVALAAGGERKVLLVDLDLTLGDVAITLQLTPERTVADLVPVADRIDETGLRTLVTNYCPGMDVLLAPVQPTVAEQVSRDLVTEILHLARGMYDVVVVDCPGSFNEHVVAALDASHQYLLVALPSVASLKNLRLLLDAFEMLDYRKENRLVVLNRADSRLGLTPADVERVLRTPISVHLPASRDVAISMNRGVPIVLENPTHPVSTAIAELTRQVYQGADPTPKRLRGLLSKLARR
ncbi:MAG TPA: AAA family ATPase [Micromonosporaceae bacterium]